MSVSTSGALDTSTDPTVERTFRLTTAQPGHRDMVFTCALADLPNRVRNAFDPAGTGTEVEVSADGSTATVLNPDGTPGFTFAVTVDDTPVVDPRRAAFELVVSGVAAGLPIPEHTVVGDTVSSHGHLILYLRDNDKNAVERWASWLDLPAPAMTLPPIKSTLHETGWFQPYAAPTRTHPATGHGVTVKTYITVPAPAAAETVEVVA